MSGRALQRLRKEREQRLAEVENDEDDGSSSDEDNGNNRQATKIGGFSGFMDDDSDSDSDASSSTDDDEDPDKEDKTEAKGIQSNESLCKDSSGNPAPSCVQLNNPGNENQDNEKENEDLDAILEEFKSQDAQKKEDSTNDKDDDRFSNYSIITSGMDTRDLDIDYVTRTSLLGRETASSGGGGSNSNRRGRQSHLFGPPRDSWPKPPRYVGGGIGMKSYKDEAHPLPWPYCDMKENDDRCPNADRWFTFVQSDSYQRDCEDFDRFIKQAGDPNSMALFVAHHPFVVEPLLQLSSLLYQTNQAQEGLSLLKRALWVFECACLNTFLKLDGSDAMMDVDLPENSDFFTALFRLVRVSYVAGLPRACFAASRFLLSLDPLRDPMGVLLAIDHFALSENSYRNDLWLVDFVDSEKVRIAWKDETSSEEYDCSLLDLPNWAYSYALALRRIHEKEPSPESEKRADDAISMAFKRFPLVLEDLLVKNEVDMSGRSFQNDWPSVVGFMKSHASDLLDRTSKTYSGDPVLKARMSQSFETVARIFVQQNFKLWSSEIVLRWCYRNMQSLKESNVDSESIPLTSPAIIRFERTEPANYEDRFQTLPADVLPLDPGLIAHAQNVDPNRPRMVQRGPRGGGMPDGLAYPANQQGFAGPPTEVIDPDWPLLEVFWRSALPWAHVEGVPPPPPPPP